MRRPGWLLHPSAFLLACWLVPGLVLAAPLPNAWQITDQSSAGGSVLNYFTNLTVSQQQSVASNGFRFLFNARLITDFDALRTISFGYGFGNKRFLLWLQLNAEGDLTAELEGGPTFTLTTNGTGSALYHTHEISYSADKEQATYRVDGEVKTHLWEASTNAFPVGQVVWGALTSNGQGQINVQSANFSSLGVTFAAYEAGTNGSPPLAPDPTTLGWTRNPSVLGPGTVAQPIAADTIGSLPNAWQITDNSTGDLLNYTRNLTAPQQNAATNATGSWHYSVNARMLTNFGGSKTIAMAYGLRPNLRFVIWWNMNTNGDLTAEVENGPTYTLTTNGTGSALYHTHEIIYTNGTASYWFDGQLKTNNWPGSPTNFTAGRVQWGASSSPGKGQMNFHSATFTVNGLGSVASYDAGMVGDPVGAPNPVDQGWTVAPSTPAVNTATNGLSPDMTLLPAALTLAANQFSPGNAQLNGQANPRGSPAWAWFEWGTSQAYGSNTVPQMMGAGVGMAGLSNSLSGLVVGTNYHFRAVVSNEFGVVNGTNRTFNLGVFLPTAVTQPADQSTATSAQLNGQVNPRGSPTTAWFDWGASTAYGTSTPPQLVGAGNSAVGFSNVINSLVGGVSYHFRSVASNAFGLVVGANRLFNLNFDPIVIPDLPGVANSSAAWGDYDNDGRLDFFITGRSVTGAVSQIWRNTGGGFSNVTASVAPGLPRTEWGSVAWGDYDNDERLDFLLTGGVGAQIWRNLGGGFSNVTTNITPGLPNVIGSSVAWGDYDNDGRLDFLLTGGDITNVSQIWRNTGSGFSNVTASVAPGLPRVVAGSVAWADYDKDQWLDFMITGGLEGNFGVSQIWRNTGGGFSNVTASVAPGLPGVYYSSLAWADYDGDGWLDFLLSGATQTDVVSQIWRNLGSRFTNVTSSVAPGLPSIAGGSVAWGDYDSDGRPDFLITGSSDVSPVGQLWRNTGNGFSNVTAFLTPVSFSSVCWGDYDNDGRLDFLITGTTNEDDDGGLSKVWRNNIPASNSPPAAPTGLSRAFSNHGVLLSWNASADDLTPAPGLDYNVRIGSAPGASDVLAPMALSNGFRLLPARGNAQGTQAIYPLIPGRTYYWSVQAVDTSFAGSPFAPEQLLILGPKLSHPIRYPGGVFEFHFTNQTALNFDVLVSTHLGLPLSSWTNLGPALSLGAGLYRFTDTLAPAQAPRFYLLRAQ